MPIVEAVMAAASIKDLSGREDKALSRRIEEAMSAAVLEAYGKGISDPAEIRKMMLAARDQAKSEAANVSPARL